MKRSIRLAACVAGLLTLAACGPTNIQVGAVNLPGAQGASGQPPSPTPGPTATGQPPVGATPTSASLGGTSAKPSPAGSTTPAPRATIKGVVRNAETGTGEPGVRVDFGGGVTVETAADGTYSASVPLGATTIMATKARFSAENSQTGVNVTEAGATVEATPINLMPLHWLDQVSGVSADLADVFALDADHAWVAGGGGTLLRTADGGTNWLKAQSTPLVTLKTVFFLDASNGWAAGAGGTILKSGDGGKTWAPQTSGTTATFNDLQFVSATVGWAVTDEAVYSTQDAGQTWQRNDATGGGGGLYFLDSNRGVVQNWSNTAVYITTTGGASWQRGSDIHGNGYPLMLSPTEVWLFTDTWVFRSNDGGVSFDSLKLISCPAAMRDPTKRSYEVACGFARVHFASATAGWRVGASGKIQRY